MRIKSIYVWVMRTVLAFTWTRAVPILFVCKWKIVLQMWIFILHLWWNQVFITQVPKNLFGWNYPELTPHHCNCPLLTSTTFIRWVHMRLLVSKIQCVSNMMTPILIRNSLKMTLFPIIMASLRGNAHTTPTKRPRNAYETPPHCVETPTKRPHSEGDWFSFREFLVRMGVIS